MEFAIRFSTELAHGWSRHAAADGGDKAGGDKASAASGSARSTSSASVRRRCSAVVQRRPAQHPPGAARFQSPFPSPPRPFSFKTRSSPRGTTRCASALSVAAQRTGGPTGTRTAWAAATLTPTLAGWTLAVA